MISSSVLPFAAAALSLCLAFASLLAKRLSLSTWCFFAGMTALSVDSVLTGLAVRAWPLETAVRWLRLDLIVRAFLPLPWLCFGLAYSRADRRESLGRWRLPLAAAALALVFLPLVFWSHLLHVVPNELEGELPHVQWGAAARWLDVFALVAFALALANLEQTFRAAVGIARWRIKFVVLGLSVILYTHVYMGSQAILFSSAFASFSGLESSGLLVGCVLLTLAYARGGFSDIDVAPSRALLRSSLTLVFAGVYLFVVGVLAHVVRRLGGWESFQFQAFVVLLGTAGLAVLLLSDRLRHKATRFVGGHLKRAQYDSVRMWTDFSRRLADVKDQAQLSAVSARLISQAFHALSVTVWLEDEQQGDLVASACTGGPGSGTASMRARGSHATALGLRARVSAFDLERVKEPWAEELRELTARQFPNGGHRWCVPLRTGEHAFGALVLADRINAEDYTVEEVALLQCIAGQMTSVLLKLRLANEVARARELEAFRTMSAFFVHDLKNAASSLNLTLKNLPVHFDDPAFRQDALRAIGNTARRIDDILARLGALRERPDFKPVCADLNVLVEEALRGLDDLSQVECTTAGGLPPILADPEQIKSLVTNLVTNARDAVGRDGRVHVQTCCHDGRVVLRVEDNGCGMSPAFLEHSLFLPFRTTKKKGLGIGLFQSRMVVEAHGGSIHVDSEPGRGTIVRVALPASEAR